MMTTMTPPKSPQKTMEPAISETVSDNPKRGRPAKFSPEALAFIKTTHPEISTRRGLLNKMHALKALRIITESSIANELLSLADIEAMRAGKPKSWKPTILAELGQIEGEKDLLVMAKLVCELGITNVHQAAKFVRVNRNDPAL